MDCLNNLQALERYGVRFIAATQGLDTDHNNPVSRFMLQVLGAAAEFERSLILERSQAGQLRYRRDFEAGKVGKTVRSRSGKDLPPHRPKKIFDRQEVVRLRQKGLSLRQIAFEKGPWRRRAGFARFTRPVNYSGSSPHIQTRHRLNARRRASGP